MSAGEIDTTTGRSVTAADTATGDRKGAPQSGPLSIQLKAKALDADVVISDIYQTAYAVINGDAKDRVRIEWVSGTWTLTWPEDAGVTSSHGMQGIQFGSGNVQSNVFSGGSYSSVSAGGRMVVNGVDVTDYVRKQGGSVEPPRVRLCLPSGCTLAYDSQSGSLSVPAPKNGRHGLHSLSFQAMSASLHARAALGTLHAQTMSGNVTTDAPTGPATVSTMSGEVELNHALGSVSARTMSGGISVHAAESIMVQANSTSGAVTVTAAAGKHPSVSAHSLSGRVRTP